MRRQEKVRRRPRASSTFVVIMLAAVTLAAAATSPAAAKKKKPVNPLAGNWVGMTESTNTYTGAPAALTYRITRSGHVVNFNTTVTLDKQPSGASCPSPLITTVTMPRVKMDKPSATYPKGKRFTFLGTNLSPPARLYANGKVGIGSKGGAEGFQGFRKMEGAITLGGEGTIVVAPNVICRTGAVYWSARRVGK